MSGVLGTLERGLTQLLLLFPPSPFGMLTTMAAKGEIAQWLSFMNWFIPVYSWLAIVQVWLTCILFYYVVQVVLRWINVIE